MFLYLFIQFNSEKQIDFSEEKQFFKAIYSLEKLTFFLNGYLIRKKF